MNVQLHQVISDITGLTGLLIIRAIVKGERNPQVLAALKHPSIRSSTDEIAAALTGDYRAEHLFVLQQELYFYETHRPQIEARDVQVEQCLSGFVDKVNVSKSPLPKPKRSGKPSTDAPSFDLRTHLYRICGVDFTKHHWDGSVNSSNASVGTRLRPYTLSYCQALYLLARTMSRQSNYRGYRRARARLGPAKATTATAHKLARIFYRLWTTGGEYTNPGADYYEQNYRQWAVKNLTKKAQQLGFDLVAQTATGGSIS